MFKLAFMLAGALSFLFTTHAPLTLDKTAGLIFSAHLPGFSLVVDQKENPETIVVEHEIGPNFILKESPQKIHLIEEEKSSIKSDLIHIFYGLARREWIKKNIFPVHASCVGNPQKGYVLIVGPSGAGKTTTSLDLVKKYSLKIFSGDKTLVKIDQDGKMWGIGGTKTLTTRLNNPPQNWFSIVDFKTVHQIDDRFFFGLKANEYAQNQVVPIKAIFFIKAYHNENRSVAITFPTSLYILYPYFIDHERSDVIIEQGKGMIRGEIDPIIEQKNLHDFSVAIKNIKIMNVTGSLSFVTSQIAKEFK